MFNEDKGLRYSSASTVIDSSSLSNNSRTNRNLISGISQTYQPSNMSPKPHVEIAAVIPDSEGRIVIGKRKGKTGNGKEDDSVLLDNHKVDSESSETDHLPKHRKI